MFCKLFFMKFGFKLKSQIKLFIINVTHNCLLKRLPRVLLRIETIIDF